MRKIVWLLLLAVWSGGALATAVWVVVGKNEKFNTYIDPATQRKAGTTVKIWELFDYKTPQAHVDGKTFLSAKRYVEYDCKGRRSRVLAVSRHAENFANGALVAEATVNANWSVPANDSADDLLWKFSCEK